MFIVLGGRVIIWFMHYMTMGSLHINGGQSGAFNASWDEWRASLGLATSLGLAFRFICGLLLALVWVKEDDFNGVNRQVIRGWFGTVVSYSSSFYHILLLIMLSFRCRVAEK